MGSKDMTDTFEIEETHNLQEYEEQYMGSLYHSSAQTRITNLLSNDERFSVFVELSLDATQIDLSQFGLKAKDKLIPDICLYPKGHLKKRGRDVRKVPDIPLLAIEVISPDQGSDEILAKFEAYFTLGVKSCWLVEPSVEVVHIYPQPSQHKTFDMNDTEIFDEIIDIHLPIQSIFQW
ncbi:hypothetical protein THIOM_000044 [Candidatus Thiomargarita nelsonii]|uniref:Putative restriction endonuclease domain-containing protein n=1 Tax=Candidatus Thiomargarita nelsonii TaxID=1003181 RepID=A0A176S7U3_9GAMM|nr:hypothetical protein THIOM_000044 [Candidatus Thiomargarita nelsonii]